MREQTELRQHIARLQQEQRTIQDEMGRTSDPAEKRHHLRRLRQAGDELSDLTDIVSMTNGNPTAQSEQYERWIAKKAMGKR